MKWKAASLVVCVFLMGAVVGGLGVHVFGDRIWSTRASSANLPMTKDDFLQQLGQQLSLTPEQSQRIEGILADTVTQFHEIYAPISPQIEQARQQGRQRIRGVLSQEQRPKFEAYVQRLDEQRKKLEREKK
jgi:hypothetical protein